MLKKQVLGVFLLGLTVCLATGSANSQEAGKFSVFGGYSYLSNSWGNGCVSSCGGGAATQLHGYSASVSYAFNNHLGLEANFAGHNGSPTIIKTPALSATNGSAEVEHQDLYTLTFGPRLALPVGNFSIFSHFLVGAARGHEGFISECLQAASGGSCFSSSSSSSHGNVSRTKSAGASIGTTADGVFESSKWISFIPPSASPKLAAPAPSQQSLAYPGTTSNWPPASPGTSA